jgi:uncharacterized membrane protein YbaN (DUF454 family)
MKTNTKGIISKLQFNALIVGLLVFAILSFILFMVESHYFWKRVAEVRMLTGAANSFQVGETVAREPKIVIMGLLAICIKYSIAVYFFLRRIRQFILKNAVVFGVVAIVLTNIINALWNIKTIVDYPWITFLEVTVALIVCVIIGYFMQLKAKWYQNTT